jgi:hypothetical protein
MFKSYLVCINVVVSNNYTLVIVLMLISKSLVLHQHKSTSYFTLLFAFLVYCHHTVLMSNVRLNFLMGINVSLHLRLSHYVRPFLL